jgi:hypothetical protein
VWPVLHLTTYHGLGIGPVLQRPRMARDDQGPAGGTLRAQMGPMTGPVSLEEPLRCRKPGSLAREVYWHLRNCSAGILRISWFA